MYQVVKRDNRIADFDISKISDAIAKAFEACDRQHAPSVIDFLALKVTANFESKIKENLISVEDIQDSVESVLVQAGYDDVAKAYIIYRRQREKIRNLNATMLDYKEIVDNYINIIVRVGFRNNAVLNNNMYSRFSHFSFPPIILLSQSYEIRLDFSNQVAWLYLLHTLLHLQDCPHLEQ